MKAGCRTDARKGLGSDGAGAGCHRAAGVPQSGPIARRRVRMGISGVGAH